MALSIKQVRMAISEADNTPQYCSGSTDNTIQNLNEAIKCVFI